MAFKAESDDPRASLSYKLRKLLPSSGARVLSADPYVDDDRLEVAGMRRSRRARSWSSGRRTGIRGLESGGKDVVESGACSATGSGSEGRQRGRPPRPRRPIDDGPAAVRWAAVVALAFCLLLLRRPETLFRASFFYEDGQVFYVGAYFGGFGSSRLGGAYAGYLHIVPRVVGGARDGPCRRPTRRCVGNVIALGVVALLAAFIASNRLSNVLPDRRTRIVLAALLLLLPGSWETLGSITLVQWYVAIYLVAGRDRRAAERVAHSRRSRATLVAGACLTGPFSILFAPLFWARALVRRDRWSAVLAGHRVGLCGRPAHGPRRKRGALPLRSPT